MNTDVQYKLDDFLKNQKTIKKDIEMMKGFLSTISEYTNNCDDIWTGSAHDSFVKEFNSISNNCSILLEKLDILADNLVIIEAMYNTHEQNASNIF